MKKTNKKTAVKKPVKNVKKAVAKPAKKVVVAAKKAKKPVKPVRKHVTKKPVISKPDLGFKPAFLSDLTEETKQTAVGMVEVVPTPAWSTSNRASEPAPVSQHVQIPATEPTPWTQAVIPSANATDPWAGCTPVLPA